MSSTTELTLNDTLESQNVYAKPTQDVICGIVNFFEPPLTDIKKQLTELDVKQGELIQKLHNENLSISEVQYSQELQAMFTKMKLYHSKLQAVKKDIKCLHERSQKLKKRAMKLKEMKENEPCEEIIVTKPTNIITAKGSTASSSQSTME